MHERSPSAPNRAELGQEVERQRRRLLGALHSAVAAGFALPRDVREAYDAYRGATEALHEVKDRG